MHQQLKKKSVVQVYMNLIKALYIIMSDSDSAFKGINHDVDQNLQKILSNKNAHQI